MRINTLLMIALVAVLGLMIGSPAIAGDVQEADKKVVKEFSILKNVDKDKTVVLSDAKLKEIEGAGPPPGSQRGHVYSTHAQNGHSGQEGQVGN